MTSAQERLVEVEAVELSGGERVPVGAEKPFRAYDPDQVLLMAPVLRDWVPDGDLAHFVADLVDSGALDLSAIYADYAEERGFPPYDPRLMVKLLVYGYAVGVTSSRKLERATYRDVAVRMLCADQHPDYRSIARFRERSETPWATTDSHSARLWCRPRRRSPCPVSQPNEHGRAQLPESRCSTETPSTLGCSLLQPSFAGPQSVSS